MKYLIKLTLPFAAIVILASCGGGDTAKVTPAEDNKTIEAAEVKQPVLKNDKLNAVYHQYAMLTSALTNSNVAEAKSAANAIETGAREVAGAEQLASLASAVTTAADIEAQRAAYEQLTGEMISLVKKEGMASGELYIEHCPMAFKNKGANWISNSKEIRNPYFGEKMMTCGEVTETIQ